MFLVCVAFILIAELNAHVAAHVHPSPLYPPDLAKLPYNGVVERRRQTRRQLCSRCEQSDAVNKSSCKSVQIARDRFLFPP